MAINTQPLINAGTKAAIQAIMNLARSGNLNKMLSSGSFYGGIGGALGSLLNPKFGGLAGNVLGQSITDLIKGGSGVGWINPGGVIDTIPGLLGLIDPKLGKTAGGIYNAANLVALLGKGQSLGNLAAGALGVGGGGSSAGMLGALGSMSALGPLAIIPAMIAVGSMLVGGQPSKFGLYGKKMMEEYNKAAQLAANPDIASQLNPRDLQFISNQLEKANLGLSSLNLLGKDKIDWLKTLTPHQKQQVGSGYGYFPVTQSAKMQTLQNYLGGQPMNLEQLQASLLQSYEPRIANAYIDRIKNEAALMGNLWGEEYNPFGILAGGETLTPDFWTKFYNKYSAFAPTPTSPDNTSLWG